MDAALLVSAGIFIVLLNVWLIPRRQGFQRSYARRGVLIGVVLVIAGIVTALG